MKADWLVAAITVLGAMAVSFALGFAINPDYLTGDKGTANDQRARGASESLPSEDVTGADLREVPRYTDSVRVKYESHDLGSSTRTEVGYVTDDEMAEVTSYYRELFGSEGWSEEGSDTDNDEFNLLVSKDEREVTVQVEPRSIEPRSIEPRSGLLEVELEMIEAPSEPETVTALTIP